MFEWQRFNRAIKVTDYENKLQIDKYFRRNKKHKKKQQKRYAKNILFFSENRDAIKMGKNHSALIYLSKVFLSVPNEIEEKIGDKALVLDILRNCLDNIITDIPDLAKLAALQCESKYSEYLTIIYAICIERMRSQGNLKEISLNALRLLRTDISRVFKAITEEERTNLTLEVDRLIFNHQGDAEIFLRQYIEPQLTMLCANPRIHLLSNDNAFSHLRSSLSIEWLKNFIHLSVDSLDHLFEIAVKHANPEELKEIITNNYTYLADNFFNLKNRDIKEREIFWLIRAFVFLDKIDKEHWDWLTKNKSYIQELYLCIGVHSYRGQYNWPTLTATKIEVILNTFIDK